MPDSSGVDNKEVVEQTVKASDENTAYLADQIKTTRGDLIDRVNQSDKRTGEIFQEHEQRDQERFTRVNRSIEELANTTKDGIGTNSSRIGTVEKAVGVVQDREARIAQDRAAALTLRQGLLIAGVGGVLTLIIYLILAASGVGH